MQNQIQHLAEQLVDLHYDSSKTHDENVENCTMSAIAQLEQAVDQQVRSKAMAIADEKETIAGLKRVGVAI